MALKVSNNKSLQPKGKNMKIPAKRTMNFVHHESSFNPARMVPVILVLIIVAAVLVKFGIIDPTAQKMAAYDDLAMKQEELANLNSALSNYDKVAYDYGRYSYGWMNEKEIGLLNRMDILKMVEDEIVPNCNIENVAITDNVMTMNIHGLTLQQASDMVMKLEDNRLVQSATVYNAVADEAVNAKIYLSIVMAKPAEEAE